MDNLTASWKEQEAEVSELNCSLSMMVASEAHLPAGGWSLPLNLTSACARVPTGPSRSISWPVRASTTSI